MRHGVAFKKHGRTAAHRRSLFRNMATSLVLKEEFETTLPRAKDLRRVVEKLITLAKVDTLANRRQAYSYLLDKAAVRKLFNDIGPRFKGRNGGYTRVLRTGFRHGDAAPLAYIGLTEGPPSKVEVTRAEEGEAPKKKAAAKKAPVKKAAPKKKASKSESKEEAGDE